MVAKNDSKKWRPSDVRFFVVWALLFIAGIAVLAYAPGAWRALGALIVGPTILTVAIMVWGFLICKVVHWCGGDYKDGWVGVLVVLSFMFLMALVVAYLKHRH